MLEILFMAIAKTLPQEAVKGIYGLIYSSVQRKIVRRSIRDFVEDEVAYALQDHNVDAKDVDIFLAKKKKYYKQEIRNRFDPVLYRR